MCAGGAGAGAPARAVAHHLQQLAAALSEDGAKQLLLAGKDGVNGAHRHASQARDVLQLGAVESPFGKDLLGRLEDMLAIEVVSRLPVLVLQLLISHVVLPPTTPIKQ